MKVKRILAGVVFLCLSLCIFAADSPNVRQVYQAWQNLKSDKLQAKAMYGDASLDDVISAINESVLPQPEQAKTKQDFKSLTNL